MRLRHGGMVLSLMSCLTFLGWSLTSAEPSFELTARYILDIVKAFRTAYVLHVVEHVNDLLKFPPVRSLKFPPPG